MHPVQAGSSGVSGDRRNLGPRWQIAGTADGRFRHAGAVRTALAVHAMLARQFTSGHWK
jgi:hypothetical protein